MQLKQVMTRPVEVILPEASDVLSCFKGPGRAGTRRA